MAIKLPPDNLDKQFGPSSGQTDEGKPEKLAILQSFFSQQVE